MSLRGCGSQRSPMAFMGTPEVHMRIPADLDEQALSERLDRFEIETPSWGYADTGTRFGKFLQIA